MNQPWTEFLARAGAVIGDSTLHFPQTESPEDTPCVAIPLVHLGLVRSSGENSAEFLHNLLSNDVKHLSDDGAQWNSLNTPKGRMLASLLLYRDLDGHGIVMSADIAPATLKRMSMYVLRSKVKLSAADTDSVLIGVSGNSATEVLGRAGISVPATMRQSLGADLRCIALGGNNFILISLATDAPEVWSRLATAGAQPAGTDHWQLAMIRNGFPLITAATQEEFVPQMLNFELIGGVSFNKGCYPGQEIVARTQYLGKLKKRMYRVRIPAGHSPQPGDDVYTPEFGEQSAGKLVNVAPVRAGGFEALAVMQTGCASNGTVRLVGSDGPALEFLPLPYPLG